MQVADETLMAFADGELPPGEADAVARQVADDPTLAARLELFRRTKTAVAGIAPAPVPAALEARIRALAATPERTPAPAAGADAGRTAEVVPFAPLRRRVPLWQVPAAAAAALVLGIGATMLARPAVVGEGTALAAALDTLPSGERRTVGGSEIVAVATFSDGEGALCREYESLSGGQRLVSVACRDADGWDLRFAVAAGAAGADYTPASSLDVLDAWMAANGAGAPMSPEDEAAALAAR